ncbi:MAG: hypothetical protein RI885_611 [Actinomycetota bacterium]
MNPPGIRTTGPAATGADATGADATAATTTAATATNRSAPVDGRTVVTPTVRASLRSARFWVVAVVLLLALAVGLSLITGVASSSEPLDPESAAPEGAGAVVEVLRQQGVSVVVTESLADTRAAASDPATTTVLVHDPDAFLGDEGWSALPEIAGSLVLLAPDFEVLDELAPGVLSAGSPDDDVLEAGSGDGGCDVVAARRAVTVSPGGDSYRVDPDVAPGAATCLRSDSEGADDAFSLVRVDGGTASVTVLGATDALTNQVITEEGNAALALGVLGQTETLVWYRPGILDSPDVVDPSEYTPAWLTPSILLLTLAVIAAAVWRGRRFGPLIVENLPVVVRSSETMEGRARLYQRGSARLRAIDALRVGTLSRVAARCGLPSTASVDEVIAAVATVVGAEVGVIRSLLLDDLPRGDADLTRLSAQLADLETEVARKAGGG